MISPSCYHGNDPQLCMECAAEAWPVNLAKIVLAVVALGVAVLPFLLYVL